MALPVNEHKPLQLRVNGTPHQVRCPEDQPLLWTLRDTIGLTGTKFGCGQGLCGACTVHLDGQAVRSCVTPTSAAAGRSVTTIEGLAQSRTGQKLQRIWVEERVSQCGYCQAGMLMACAALIEKGGAVSRDKVCQTITNLCRCGSHPRVIKATTRAGREA